MKKARREVLNQYAVGKLDRDAYAEKSLWYDNEINKLILERSELIKQVPTLHRSEVVEASVRSFCEAAKAEFKKCYDLTSKRKFLFKYVGEIVYNRRNVQINGSVPLNYSGDESDEIQKISFKIATVAKQLSRRDPLYPIEIKGG